MYFARATKLVFVLLLTSASSFLKADDISISSDTSTPTPPPDPIMPINAKIDGDIKAIGTLCTGIEKAYLTADGGYLVIYPKSTLEMVLQPAETMASPENCNFVINLSHSDKWQYKIETLYFPYQVNLQPDINSVITVKTFAQGSPVGIEKSSFKGKINAYGFLVFEPTKMGLSKCGGGRSLIINSNILIERDGSAVPDKPSTARIQENAPIVAKLVWSNC